MSKWTEERTAQLVDMAGESPVSQNTVSGIAEALDFTTRSVSSKLRKMGYEVESAAVAKKPTFSEAQEATLRTFVTDNSGEYTYAQIAELFADGEFTAKQVQGKILSMELTGHVKPAEKVEVARKYSEEEEARFVEMVNGGAFVEQIAEAFGRSVSSVRGKALSLLRSGHISAIPKQEHVKGKEEAADPLGAVENVAERTVAEIAELIGKTERGVKTMLTRRGITVSDYDGAARKEKAAAAKQ